jgi:hypothetical protein
MGLATRDAYSGCVRLDRFRSLAADSSDTFRSPNLSRFRSGILRVLELRDPPSGTANADDEQHRLGCAAASRRIAKGRNADASGHCDRLGCPIGVFGRYSGPFKARFECDQLDLYVGLDRRVQAFVTSSDRLG